MAPEVLMRKQHGIEVDYYSMGVLMYELIMSSRPYTGKSKKKTREFVLSKQIFLGKKDLPDDWSLEAADFTNKLISRRPYERLGASGPLDVKRHAWLRNFPWKGYSRKLLYHLLLRDVILPIIRSLAIGMTKTLFLALMGSRTFFQTITL